ncbi:MAG: TonB-dependent receptor [Bacteroidetes bacterium MedPE-SWsnd-G1]|nr:MAG: TonB-dependent receptor [Bacteroidetes bacterium MedPE-SWsnd-G1]
MKKVLFLTALILFNFSLFGQSLNGKIIDIQQNPIQEVNIRNISTDSHAHSNEKGTFILENVSVNDTLILSHVSYKSKQLIVTAVNTTIEIMLKSKSINLDEIVISPKRESIQLIADIDVQTNPVNSSQDILRKVPGLFIGQHAGGGKAEQIFLRGFDIDHGTDIGITVDGIPVNMVSHAHGQGYSDLHFVIPETINNIDFGKGPYYEGKGNFTTAGYVDFNTKENLDYSSIKMEIGQFDSSRLLGMFNILNSQQHNAYVAAEFIATDGPFESPQNFNRFNIFGKYTGAISDKDKVGLTLSHFTSHWDASGQIPQRAVDSGMITRFGAIDDTEGGNTSRTNVLFNYDTRINEFSTLKNTVFMSHYDFELYSNFTFYLNDPINGDQIRQKEDRIIYGFTSEYTNTFSKGEWHAGISLRKDQSKDNELSHTANRIETLDNIQLGDINETNFGGYVGARFDFNNWSIYPSIRFDYFEFNYYDQLLPTYQTQEENEFIASPKLNVFYNPSSKLQLYAKAGKGFHSNDTRVVVAQNGKDILPAAYGFDIGYTWKPLSKTLLNMAYWNLFLEQEFVYVGDAGIVEPSGKTQRHGVEFSFRYQPLTWLYWNLDANYTIARATEEPDESDDIPLAPDFTLVSGLNFIFDSGFYGGINLRHIKDRPANEDNSIVAKGYTVTDLNAGYTWKKFNFGIQIQNLFDTEWNETQFATESRLQNEISPVEEIHFTPGTSFYFKASIEYRF